MNKILTLIATLFFASVVFGQEVGTIKGIVLDENESPLIGSTILIEGTTQGTTADIDGSYTIPNVAPGSYQLEFSFMGFSAKLIPITVTAGQTTTINATLGEDALQMDEIIVTGALDKRTKLESSVAITSMDAKVIEQRSPRGTGELIAAVPGTFVDNSSGEVGATVYARGLATGIRTQPGFHYVSLQEDGLPVLSTQFQFSIMDMYHRPDGTVGKFEAIRGGSASTSSANSPGGIFNFISNEGKDKLSAKAKFQFGLQGSLNSLVRTDVNVGGPIKNNWYYNLGGFYRMDEGARELPYNANVGGQFKANVVRKHDRGNFKIYGKLLNDKVSRYEYIPINNLVDITPIADFNLHTSTIYPDVIGENLPDGEYFMNDETRTRTFDPSKGIKTQNYALGASLSQEAGRGWIVRNNLKYSYANQQYSQYAGNIIFEPETGLAEFFQLPTFIFNDFDYKDFATGEVLYNKGDGIEQIDKIWAAAGFTIENKIHDFINQFSVSKEIKRHQFSVGFYASHADVDVAWTGDAIASTLEANPRPFLITHPKPSFIPGNFDFKFSDPNTGLIALGSSAYNRAVGQSSTFSVFATDLYEISEKLNIDIGVRVENVFHKGQNERFILANQYLGDTIPNPDIPIGFPVGVDGDFSTFYDAGTRLGTGEFDAYNFTYTYGSGSLGINYKFNEGLAVYGRGTIGNKAPELGYYISNFSNQAINRGFVEKIYMGEAGVKLRGRKGSIFLTGFYSRMNDVAFQLLVPGEGGIVVFTPSTFNKIQTLGSELEVVLYPVKGLNIRMMVTAQNPRFVEFNYYNLNGTANPVFIDPITGEKQVHPENPTTPGKSPYSNSNGELEEAGAESDDYIEQFSGNSLANVPKILSDITVSYKLERFTFYVNSRYTGKRSANRRNTLVLPGFAQFNGGIDGKITKNISASIKVNNIFNAAGLMDFDGLGFLGQTKEDLTEAVILENQNADTPNPYFIRPVLPRIITASLSYEF